tara:strand:+ start:1336 stop:2856 length:1521 start_codon:yes stop_codon:yes gene_type:complete
MIISHKHKFIFFKTRKTAGSSIQVALGNHCGENDIITGQYREGVDDNSHSAGLNMSNFYTNHPHPEIIPTKSFIENNIGRDVWDSYFKFAFIRNPYDIAVSRYHWDRKKRNRKDEISIDDFRNWVKHGKLTDEDWLYKYISTSGSVDLDFVGRYENLSNDLEYICEKIGIPNLNLGFLKSGFRDKKIKYTEYYDDDTKNIVSNFFETDLNLFNYKFESEFNVQRVKQVIFPQMLKHGGENINGPSVIKVPEWVNNPLGKYYMYFANHDGKYIRLAYSDNLLGDWKLHDGGTLKLEESECIDHIASPDVHVDNDKKRILMYYHGKVKTKDAPHNQCTFLSFSKNGLDFNSNSGILGMFYFRVFKYKNKFYSLAKNKNTDGILYESDDGVSNFKPIFNLIPNIRHSAVLVENDNLYIFYTIVGSAPESILYCKIKLSDDINDWEIGDGGSLLKPERDYEGFNLPIVPSSFGTSFGMVNEVRDPFVFVDDRKYLFYSIAGETGIAVAII